MAAELPVFVRVSQRVSNCTFVGWVGLRLMPVISGPTDIECMHRLCPSIMSSLVFRKSLHVTSMAAERKPYLKGHLSRAVELLMLRMGEYVTKHKRRAINYVCLWQLPQFHGLQKSYQRVFCYGIMSAFALMEVLLRCRIGRACWNIFIGLRQRESLRVWRPERFFCSLLAFLVQKVDYL